MQKSEIFRRMKAEIDRAPRNGYVAELHLQCIKFADQLDGVSGREFAEGIGVGPAWGTEFVKMRKIVTRLKEAGLDLNRI